MNLNLKKLDRFAELKLELEKIIFLNSNSNKTRYGVGGSFIV